MPEPYVTLQKGRPPLCSGKLNTGRALLIVFTVLFTLACTLSGSAAEKPPARKKGTKPPFAYEPLNVRNSCFVESVHFYDEYFRKKRDGEQSWARVLQWGNEMGDYKIVSGHAVAVFSLDGKLWSYDVNYGFEKLPVSAERRGDIRDVSPPIFSNYPQYQAVNALYRDDFPQEAPKKRVEYLFYHKNPDIRDATKVASWLGAERPTRVFEYDFTKDGKTVHSAAATFLFGARVCVYFPRYGTFVAPNSTLVMGSIDDLRFLNMLVRRLFKDGGNVRWQPGGYAFFPPKEEKPAR